LWELDNADAIVVSALSDDIDGDDDDGNDDNSDGDDDDDFDYSGPAARPPMARRWPRVEELTLSGNLDLVAMETL
jgi:hypothetical protein